MPYWRKNTPSVPGGPRVTFSEPAKTLELPKRVLGAVLEIERFLYDCDDEVSSILYDLHNYKHHFKKFSEIQSRLIYKAGPDVEEEDTKPLVKLLKEMRYQFGTSEDVTRKAKHEIEITFDKVTARENAAAINLLRYKNSSMNKISYNFESTHILDDDLKALEAIRVLTQSLVNHLPRRFHRDFNTPLSFLNPLIDKYYIDFLERKLKLFVLVLFMFYITIHFTKIKEAFLRRG